MELIAREEVGMRGLMRIAVCDPDGRVVEERENPNLICNAGLAQLASAVVWSLAADQNANLGNVLNPTFGYPMYGAVGSGTTSPLATDTQLAAELGRAVVSQISSSGGQVLITFFFGTTAVDWSIQECGVFLSGGAGTATASANTGLLLNHALTGGVTKLAAQTATFQAAFTF